MCYISEMNMEQFIKDTLFEAGDKLLALLGNAETLYAKQTVADIVTEADLASNVLICDAIKKHFPDHGIVSEEGEGHQPESEYQWYVDPLDGTKNFASHTPLFGINIGLTHKGEVTHAAIHLPYMKEFYYAEKGNGAYLNGEKMRCSQKEDWKGTYGLGTIRLRENYEKFQQGINALSEETGWTNAVASSAVSGAWVSCGRRDWYIGPGANAWDYAATSLIAREAGCLVANFAGMDYRPGDRGLVVANPSLFPQLIELIKKSQIK